MTTETKFLDSNKRKDEPKTSTNQFEQRTINMEVEDGTTVAEASDLIFLLLWMNTSGNFREIYRGKAEKTVEPQKP